MDVTACIACGSQCIKGKLKNESFFKELQKSKSFSKINYRPALHPFLFMKTTRLSASPHTCTCNVRSTPHHQGCCGVDASTTGMIWLPMADTLTARNRPSASEYRSSVDEPLYPTVLTNDAVSVPITPLAGFVGTFFGRLEKYQ
jgi:hypothetical protein